MSFFEKEASILNRLDKSKKDKSNKEFMDQAGIAMANQRIARERAQELVNIQQAKIEDEKQKQISAAASADLAKEAKGLALNHLKADPSISQSNKEKASIAVTSDEAIDEKAKEINNTSDSKQDDSSSLANQFKEALTFFAPQLIAGAIGGVMEGDEGLYAGAQLGGQLRDQYVDYKTEQRKLLSKSAESPKLDLTPEFQDKETGAPRWMRKNPTTGLPEIVDELGNKYESGSVIRADLARQREREEGIKERQEKSLEFGHDKFKYKQGEDVIARKQKIIKNFNDNKQMNAARDSMVAADKAMTILKGNGKLAPSVMGRLLARMAGEVGVMTDQDVAAFRGSAAWTDSLERWFVRGTQGKLTAEDKVEMQKMAKELRAASAESIEGWADTQALQSAEYAGLSKDYIRNMILPKKAKDLFKDSSKSKQETPKYDMNEVDRILKQRGAL